MTDKRTTAPALLREVISQIEQRLRPLESQEVLWDQAAGRVLAQAITAPVSLPSFPRAAMDGFALRSGDVESACPERPRQLQVRGVAYPARPWPGTVSPGSAVRIMTGAAIPEGADTVVMLEDSEVSADGQLVSFRRPSPPGRHVIAVGEDVRAGQTVLPAGRLLRPQDVALLVALGLTSCPVVQQPRVMLLVTGSELVPPGFIPKPGEVVDSNTPLLQALIPRDGGQVVDVQRVPDDPTLLRQAFRQALATDIDVVLVSGGSSTGDEDFCPQVLAEMGELVAQGLAIRPAAPTGLGWLKRAETLLPVVLLPGNPVACLVAYELLAGRIIRHLAGRSLDLPHRQQTVPLRESWSSPLGRLEWVRVCIEQNQAVPLRQRGASSIFSLVAADGFFLVPEEVTLYPAGTMVTVYLFDTLGGQQS
jgi:molybdopterin molybdotransferase